MDSFPAGERPIDLNEAAKFLPKRNGKKVCVRTIERWIRYGRKGVRLDGYQFGGGLATTREAILRFGKELLAAANSNANAKNLSATKPSAKSLRAGKALEKLGVGRKRRA